MATAVEPTDVFAQLEALENQVDEDYRQTVLAFASGAAVKPDRIRSVLKAAEIPLETFRRHVERMQRRHELVEQRREAVKLTREIAEHKRQLDAAHKQYEQIERENMARLAPASDKIRQHSQAVKDLEANQSHLQSDATAELVQTADPAISKAVHEKITEKNELEKQRAKYQAELKEKSTWRKQFVNWGYAADDRFDKVVFPDWHPARGHLGLPRRLTQDEVDVAEKRVAAAEQRVKKLATTIEEIDARVAELNKEINELNQKKFDPAAMSWAVD